MKNLDTTYEDTWIRRESNLENISYKDYLNSEWWKEIKKKTKTRPQTYSKCQFCNNNKNIELHHTSYKHIFTKNELATIIPLCREHHQEVHDYAKRNNLSVRVATNKLRLKYKPNWMELCKSNLKNKIT
jgi:hypothetical protein